MADSRVSSIHKLRKLRNDLCEKERIRELKRKQQAWLVEQVSELKNFVENDSCTIDCVKGKIAQILKELEAPGEKNEQ